MERAYTWRGILNVYTKIEERKRVGEEEKTFVSALQILQKKMNIYSKQYGVSLVYNM